LRKSLCETPGFVWVFPEAAVPGATLWRGLRGWVDCLRGLGVRAGDRIVLAGRPDFGWLGAMLAGLWLEATLVPLPGKADPGAILEALDARLVIGLGGQLTCDAHGQPQQHSVLRPAQGRARPEVRFLLRTSGTGGEARWIALSDANLQAVLASHLPVLGLGPGHRLLSTLPWSHAFGLVLECLTALQAGASLVRSADSADPVEHLRLARTWKLDWWCAVPAMVRRFAALPGGPEALCALRGGLIGGAALTPETCAPLAGTRLRVGYGQTEASPGILLGEPGEFAPGLLGRPLGCAVRLGEGGTIEFSGPNACLGSWPLPEEPVVAAARNDWLDTGDLARLEAGAYFFEGRRDDLIRLDNGRTLAAAACEQRLRLLCPAAGELMLWSPDGRHLALAFTGAAPSAAALEACLGPLAGRLSLFLPVPADAWRFTPKGDTDRVALRCLTLLSRSAGT
jgi:long-subunit acyl-CoA synthetase (AMP-forming)